MLPDKTKSVPIVKAKVMPKCPNNCQLQNCSEIDMNNILNENVIHCPQCGLVLYQNYTTNCDFNTNAKVYYDENNQPKQRLANITKYLKQLACEYKIDQTEQLILAKNIEFQLSNFPTTHYIKGFTAIYLYKYLKTNEYDINFKEFLTKHELLKKGSHIFKYMQQLKVIESGKQEQPQAEKIVGDLQQGLKYMSVIITDYLKKDENFQFYSSLFLVGNNKQELQKNDKATIINKFIQQFNRLSQELFKNEVLENYRISKNPQNFLKCLFYLALVSLKLNIAKQQYCTITGTAYGNMCKMFKEMTQELYDKCLYAKNPINLPQEVVELLNNNTRSKLDKHHKKRGRLNSISENLEEESTQISFQGITQEQDVSSIN